ncbi:MAG: DNA polymerase-2 [Bermanella sp.]|jgi:DNA polymerase-2
MSLFTTPIVVLSYKYISTKVNVHGFILSEQWLDTATGLSLRYWLSTDNGPIAIEFNQQETVCFCPQDRVKDLPDWPGLRSQNVDLKHFSGQPVAAVYCQRYALHLQLRNQAKSLNMPLWEAEIKPSSRFLMERFLNGSVFVQSSEIQTPYITNPKIKASNYQPNLKLTSVDIETSMPSKTKKEKLYSIGFVTQWEDQKGVHRETCVFMLGDPCAEHPKWLSYFKNVRSLLIAANEYVKYLDPDVFVGWNVIKFDFVVLERVYREHAVPFNWSRESKSITLREGHNNLIFIDIPGRVIIDGIDSLRNATYSFESFSLEFVSRALLGTGKKIDKKSINNRGQAITDLFVEDKLALAKYNAKDCELVLDIFDNTGILQYLIQRSFLTGHLLDRIGGSVAAFEFLYLPKLHRAGYIAPNLGEGYDEITAPGGFVMDSQPGLYNDVLVLDFKSLYPSIIRTFKIDPMGLIEGNKDFEAYPENCISGFHNAQFHKYNHFLPTMIEQLWDARDRAKKQNNAATSQAIKIIMNSFYGILGSTGCRFFDARLASSITERGHQIIQDSAKWINEKGHEVIYGDTDSVFVFMKNKYSGQQAKDVGYELQAGLNRYWTDRIKSDFGIESHLEIEFESHYTKFLMPTIRGSELGSKKRYAGLNDDNKMIFKGLEAVRSDWTILAKSVQTELYTRIFHGNDYIDYLTQELNALKQGERDNLLVYKKRIRKPLSTYVKNTPPQIQAAKKAASYYNDKNLNSPYEYGGWIEYIITQQGPMAIECLEPNMKINYDHYIEKQLTPVIDSILYFLGTSFDSLTNPQGDIFAT